MDIGAQHAHQEPGRKPAVTPTATEILARRVGIPTFHIRTAAEKALKPVTHSIVALSKHASGMTMPVAEMLRSYQDYLVNHCTVGCIAYFTRWSNGSWKVFLCRIKEEPLPARDVRKVKEEMVDAFERENLPALLDYLEGKIASYNWNVWKKRNATIFGATQPLSQ